MVVSKNKLIVQVKELYKEIERPPLKKDIKNSPKTASWSAFYKHFGSLDEIYKQAEIDTPIYHKLTKKQLYELHVNQNKKIDEICALTQRSYGTIHRRLKKYGILRNFRAEVLPNKEQHEIIEGILVSDGWIAGKLRNRLSISQKYDKEEFVKHIAQSLPFKHSVRTYKFNNNWQKHANDSVRYSSFAYPIIEEYWKRWYPESNKIVPSDFKITPISLLYWYCGDGNLHKRNKYVRLHTNSFCKIDVKRLSKQFKEKKMHVTISKKNEICIWKEFTNTFFDYIGWECPFTCFEYKWPKERIVQSRMTMEEKEKILHLYKETHLTPIELSKMFHYSRVAITRFLRLNIPKMELESLRKSKRKNIQ